MTKYWCNGKIIEVLQGLGDAWMVGTMKKNGTGRSRFVSKACPVRTTREESEADLKSYAAKNGLRPVIEEDGV
jgi:hypothetical protein